MTTPRQLLLKHLLLILMIAAIAVTAASLLRAQPGMALARKMAATRQATDLPHHLPDGLHVGLCCAGSPIPDDRRAGPCTVIVAGKRLFVFDAGSGSARNIGKMGFIHGHIEAIFLTHFHSDHIDGLGELLMLRWVSTGNVHPVAVYGPVGVEEIVAGIAQTYAQDRNYRVAFHGDATLPASGFGATAHPFSMGAGERTVLIKDADLEIIAFQVDHGPVHPAVGYRIQYKGRSVVLSGDTKKTRSVEREAAGVDVLVHEALSTPLMAILEEGAAKALRPNLQKIFADSPSYRTSPEEAAEIARDARVDLLLNHIAPGRPVPGLEQAFLGRTTSIYRGPVRVGMDGDFLSMPAGSRDIQISWRLSAHVVWQ